MYKGNFLLFLLFSLKLCSGCNNSVHNKLYSSGRFLVAETYSKSNKLLAKQYYNQDTIPDGPKFEYYNNGNIKKWSFYYANIKTPPDSLGAVYANHRDIDMQQVQPGDKNYYPDCIFYYDQLGVLDTFVGTVFIRTGVDTSSSMWASLVNPPNVNVIIAYLDYVNDVLDTSFFYYPTCTDTCCWVNIKDYKPLNGHEYELAYFIADSMNRPRMSTNMELKNIPLPQKR